MEDKLKNNKVKLIVWLLIGIFAVAIILYCCARGKNSKVEVPKPGQTGQIFLYGEMHDKKSILKKELEIWNMYYHDYNMRDLFIEYPCYTAEYLNIWMKSDDD